MIKSKKGWTTKGKKTFAKVVLISYAINVNAIIFYSYFNNFQVTIYTHLFGEGIIEFVIVPIVTLVAIYWMVR